MKTFEQCKKELAIEWQYDSWNSLVMHLIIDSKTKLDFYNKYEKLTTEAAEKFEIQFKSGTEFI